MQPAACHLPWSPELSHHWLHLRPALAGAGSWLAMDAQGHFRGMGARGPGWGESEGVRIESSLKHVQGFRLHLKPGPWAENKALPGQPANGSR